MTYFSVGLIIIIVINITVMVSFPVAPMFKAMWRRSPDSSGQLL